MKAIINGILFNTATAKLLGGNGYGYPGDIRYWYEALYRKANGEYFLHGMGGAMSRYSERTGTNEWSGSEKIIPMTPAEARAWAEDNLEADDFISIFGEPDESGDHVSLTVSISRAAFDKLSSDAAKKIFLSSLLSRI